MSFRQIWGSEMGKPHTVELRERALRLVEQGNTHAEAARRLCVSIKFVNDMVRLKREADSKRQTMLPNINHIAISGRHGCNGCNR